MIKRALVLALLLTAPALTLAQDSGPRPGGECESELPTCPEGYIWDVKAAECILVAS